MVIEKIVLTEEILNECVKNKWSIEIESVVKMIPTYIDEDYGQLFDVDSDFFVARRIKDLVGQTAFVNKF